MWCPYLEKVHYWSMSQNKRWILPSTWTTRFSTLTIPLMKTSPMSLFTSNYSDFFFIFTKVIRFNFISFNLLVWPDRLTDEGRHESSWAMMFDVSLFLLFP